ncbi:exosortase C-terminal domain/associated protein EpsI [Thioalkalivibrio sp. XN8]|uniref:exosortase C-terminal domain/associated protein EpsI n=1 Tax=Thioalkalivibrio sp. XN8 TaxID=2712863 RepID=UPI0013ECA8AF|nr:exosortase C-terminal domain/associated protein EpsI [Thioalkalivibrio sp. XN8]NGP53715.1 EpsI family protein [Thioalkalivibrio sp. XN8]
MLIATALLAAGAIIGMPSILSWVAGSWYSFFGVSAYSHGYLVLGLAAWIGWTHWRRDPPERIGPAWSALVPLALLVVAMVAMELIYINSSRALLLPPMFVAATALVFGWPAAKRVVMPAGFVYLGLLPFWVLQPALQALATRMVNLLMSFGNVPVHIEEFFIHIPAGTFEVVSSCSGLSTLLSALTLALFYDAMYLRRWRHRLILLGAAIAAALVSNWVRIWTLVLIGQYLGLDYWLIGDHYAYGMVLFLIFLVPVGLLAARLEDREQEEDEEPSSGRTMPAPRVRARTGPMLAAALAGALLLAAPRLFATDGRVTYEVEPLPLPEVTMGNAVRVGDLSSWQPRFRNARVGSAVYQADGGRVEAYRAAYPQQDREHHLFQDRRSLHGRDWWELEHRQREVQVGVERITVNEFVGRLSGRERITLAWYEVAGQPVTSRLAAKLAEARALGSGRTDGVLVAVSKECEPGCDEARAVLERFLENSGASLRWQPGP